MDQLLLRPVNALAPAAARELKQTSHRAFHLTQDAMLAVLSAARSIPDETHVRARALIEAAALLDSALEKITAARQGLEP